MIKDFGIIEPIKKEFMPKFERFEPVARDSTCIATAKQCFRKYFFSMVIAFRVPKGGVMIYLPFGACYHTFRHELENQFKIHGLNGLDKCLQPAWNKAEKDWPGDPLPKSSKWDYLTKEYLLVSCIVAFNHWKNEKIQGLYEILATEQPFEVMIDGKRTSGGTADQILRWNSDPWGRDFKTTGKEPQWYERGDLDPKDQFIRYTHGEGGLIGEEIKGQIVEVLFHHKVTKTHNGKPFIRSFIVAYTPSQIERWKQEQIVFEKLIDICRKADVWPACETFCSYCDYHSVCKIGTERGMAAKLQQNFIQKHWDFKNIDNTVER